MIQSSFVENRSAFFRVLSDDQIWEIKQAAFDVLEKTGYNVLHEGAAKLLKQAGAVVSRVGWAVTRSRPSASLWRLPSP